MVKDTIKLWSGLQSIGRCCAAGTRVSPWDRHSGTCWLVTRRRWRLAHTGNRG